MIIIPGESIAALDRIGPVLPDPRLAVPVSIMPIPAPRQQGAPTLRGATHVCGYDDGVGNGARSVSVLSRSQHK